MSPQQPVACLGCDARWVGLKIEHCTICHATFTSTSAGDRHLVERDPVTGRSRHLSAEDMAGLVRSNGQPVFKARMNPFGTVLWSKFDPRPHPGASARRVDGRTG